MSLLSVTERIHDEQLKADTQWVTKGATSVTLKNYERYVMIDSSVGTPTITLPPVAEMMGKMVVLYVTAYTNAITIAAPDSVDFAAPSFGEVNDGAVLLSDGIHWWTVGVRT